MQLFQAEMCSLLHIAAPRSDFEIMLKQQQDGGGGVEGCVQALLLI